MEVKKGDIISKKQFLEPGLYAKEEYEGLIVSSDQKQGCYNLGIQLDEERIMVVDQAREDEVEDKIRNWASHIGEIQREHDANGDTQTITGLEEGY
jgi:hypothetical protein